MKTISKDEAKTIADGVFKKYPNANKVIVATDGQAFISDINDMAAKNHSVNNRSSKELELFTFLREGETAKSKVEYAKTVRVLTEEINAATTLDALQEILDAENATGAPRKGVLTAIEAKQKALKGE